MSSREKNEPHPACITQNGASNRTSMYNILKFTATKNNLPEKKNQENPFLSNRNSLMEKQQEEILSLCSNTTILQSADAFLKTFSNEGTRKQALSTFKMFFKGEILSPNMTLYDFSIVNTNNILDSIQGITNLAKSTKQTRAALFISFTKFLNRKLDGLIRVPTPNREKGRETFKKIRDKTVYDPLMEEEIFVFLKHLKKESLRNYLIAACQLQGAKRISEVLNSRIEDIDWTTQTIKFKQLKMDIEKFIVVTFHEIFMERLQSYLCGRSEGFIFLTSSGEKMKLEYIMAPYKRAFKAMGKSGSTHTLRSTSITLMKTKGFSDEEVMELSGHICRDTLSYYDKRVNPNPSENVDFTWSEKIF